MIFYPLEKYLQIWISLGWAFLIVPVLFLIVPVLFLIVPVLFPLVPKSVPDSSGFHSRRFLTSDALF